MTEGTAYVAPSAVPRWPNARPSPTARSGKALKTRAAASHAVVD
jgi:hypothetical protein